MKREGEDASFDRGCVDGRFHVTHGVRVVWTLDVVALPVVRDGRRHLPAQPVDHVGIGVILDVIDEVSVSWHVLGETLSTIVFEHQVSWKNGIVGRKQHEHRRVHPKESALGSGLSKDLCIEARAHGIHRVAARHAERDRLGVRNRGEQVDAPIVRRFGLGEVVAMQARARMVVRVSLDTQTFRQPGLQLRIAWIGAGGHNAHRGPAVDLLQTIQNWSQETLVAARIVHIVDG